MQPKLKWLVALDIVSSVLFFTAAAMVFFYAPLERVMGAVQKVFYFHVAAGGLECSVSWQRRRQLLIIRKESR